MKRIGWLLVAGLIAGVGMALLIRLTGPPGKPDEGGTLLAVGPSAKGDPYAVAQGAVTHGEAVLLDFGDGELVFFVNRPEDNLMLSNGCGEQVAPGAQRRWPFLIEARFSLRSAPPYTVTTPTTRYRFTAPDQMTSCGPNPP